MKKILLIEDNTEMRENTAEILELASYTVLCAANGKAGVELALAEQPDLIICDIMMPVLDGYGVLHLLSKNEKTSNIPFIFLSAKAERSDIRRGMELGADDYLPKPFDESELLSAVESRLRRTERLRNSYDLSEEGISAFINDARIYEELQNLRGLQQSRVYKKGELIYSEGSMPHGLYFVKRGKVRCFRTHELGKEFITGLYSDSSFFGYLALMEERAYTDSAQTLDESEICFIDKEDFVSLLFKNAEISRRFIRLLADELEQKEEQLVQLAYNSVRRRVADALLQLMERFSTSDKTKFKMSISRENLASLAGTATETTIRTLSDFKEEGLVEIHGSSVEILQATKLAKMRN